MSTTTTPHPADHRPVRTHVPVTQPWRFPAILGLSILFGLPAIGQMATADPDALVRAGLRYLAGFALAWLGVAAIGRLVDGYAAHNQRLADEQAAAIAEAARAESDLHDAVVLAGDATADLSSPAAMS